VFTSVLADWRLILADWVYIKGMAGRIYPRVIQGQLRMGNDKGKPHKAKGRENVTLKPNISV